MTINMDDDFLYDIEVNSGKGKIVFLISYMPQPPGWQLQGMGL